MQGSLLVYVFVAFRQRGPLPVCVLRGTPGGTVLPSAVAGPYLHRQEKTVDVSVPDGRHLHLYGHGPNPARTRK